MLSVRDDTGNVVGFVGRALPDADTRSPRYLNSPQTALYDKSRLLFGLAEGSCALALGGRVVLVEGPLDAIAVSLSDPHALAGVAVCGTAVTEHHVEALLAAVPPSRVVVAFDADAAGRQASENVHSAFLARGAMVCGTELPAGADPC